MDAGERALPASIGRYQIERLLGRGAMGRVLLAHDPVLDRAVAVKLLRDDLRIPPEQLQGLLHRMRQEARASARVAHPNIVGLFDMGEDPELGLFLVFEYASGSTLKERLKQGPLSPPAAARLAREIGDALSTAHSAGVLHRDIKPENIILTKAGSKIADFGIARVPDSTLTRDGGLLGTPAYSAPESITRGDFSPRSAQFSMAATLYEAISQRRAFAGEDAVAVASRITTEEAPPLARACGVPLEVDLVLKRALAKEPSARFESAREFGEKLAEALDPLPRKPLDTLPDARHRLAAENHAESQATRFALGGAALGLLLGAAGMHLSQGLKSGSEVAPASPASSTTQAPIGWLAEGPPPKPAPQPKIRSAPALPRGAPTVRSDRNELVDAGTPSPIEDAGAPPPDAGLEPR
ncbi:MAG TPA: serine/threonine-protein kinase [Polyangiaceae bacterium]|nr:serine/threonine-protein kinase [Polyangiaceae bacterium]